MRVAIALSCLVLLASCTPVESTDSNQGAPEKNRIATLPLSSAPAPTREFAWGMVDVTAPGFVGPPADVMTIALDMDQRLRYLGFSKLPALNQAFGDAEDEFPLAGSRHVNLYEGYDVTVEETAPPTPTSFASSYHVVSQPASCDFIESTEGVRSQDGWQVTFSRVGTYFVSPIDAHASGTIYNWDPQAPPPETGQATWWEAPVEVVAPGFTGPPVDHLRVYVDGAGRILSLLFEDFPRHNVTFGTGPDDLAVYEPATIGDRVVTADPTIEPTPDHFVLRYHVVEPSRQHDFVEGIDGTREGDHLVVRYFIEGTLSGAEIDAHAAGNLSTARAP